MGEAGEKIQLTPAVVMRRMTKVSPYPYLAFLRRLPAGYLRAVYRGNGIPNYPGATWRRSPILVRSGLSSGMSARLAVPTAVAVSVLRDGDQSLLYWLSLAARQRHGGQSPCACR